MQEHKRKNLQDAFIGDPDPLSEGSNTDLDAPEAVEFKIKTGILRTQVPVGTPTEEVIGPDRFYEVDVILDDNTRVAIQIAEGAEGVNVVVHGKANAELSGIEAANIPRS